CKFVGPWRKSDFRVPERSVFEGRHRNADKALFQPGITKNAPVVSGGFPERHACQLRQMAGKVGASASRIDRVEIIMPAGGGDSGNQHVEGCFVRETPDSEEILTGRKRLCRVDRPQRQSLDTERRKSAHPRADFLEEGLPAFSIECVPARFRGIKLGEVIGHVISLRVSLILKERPASVRLQMRRSKVLRSCCSPDERSLIRLAIHAVCCSKSCCASSTPSDVSRTVSLRRSALSAWRLRNPSRSSPSSRPVMVARVTPARSESACGERPSGASCSRNSRTNLPSESLCGASRLALSRSMAAASDKTSKQAFSASVDGLCRRSISPRRARCFCSIISIRNLIVRCRIKCK